MKESLSLMLIGLAMIGLAGGLLNRIVLKKGIGAQFVRYTALAVGLPVAAALAVENMLTEAAVTLLLGILGYVFAPGGKESD